MLLLQVTEYATPVLITLGCLLSAGLAMATFFITRSYYKAGFADKKAGGYKELYDLEEERATKYEGLYKEEVAARKRWEAEKSSLLTDYTQMAELLAKKSILFEAITGFYGRAAGLVQAGNAVRALKELTIVGDMEDSPEEIHRTKS
jgi:hypothetical protein